MNIKKNYPNFVQNFLENKVLPSYMKDEPKMNPLFSTTNLINNYSELIIFNVLLEDCPRCLSKKKNPIIISSCLHIFCKHVLIYGF